MADEPSLEQHIEAGRRSAGQLAQAWPWLAEALIPGPVFVIERTADPDVAEYEAAEHYKDQAAKFAAIKAGVVPSGPRPAPPAAPIRARAAISGRVATLAGRLREHVHPGSRGLNLSLDPTTRVTRRRCWRCEGAGWLPVHGAAVSDEPTVCPVCRSTEPSCACGTIGGDRPPLCPRCEGIGHVSAGIACVVCRSIGPCRCDTADAIIAAGIPAIRELLLKVTDLGLARHAARVLDRADTRARRIAGVGEDRRIIKAPCPACNRRGDFYAEVSSHDRTEWKARCDFWACICRGTACGCGRPNRTTGIRHLWPAAEWDGPDGLAARLGVELPGTTRQPPADEDELAEAGAA